jgi:serine/threonine-protein kinase
MGLVYRAFHSELQRTGAVKVLQAIAPDKTTKARFRHEAQAIAQLRHPNIVNVYDFGEYQGTPYMIVEYVPGGSLSSKLGEGRLDSDQALKYLRGIADGLDYAHGMGVVHRDVKPANVLLETDDSPVLADFGLAKLTQGSSLKSLTGATTGTPAYMAPEQVTGSDVGPAADRYSLATIAYEMFAGVIPFDGQGLMELLYAHVHRDPVPPSTHNRSLSTQVDGVILRGLARDPATRWESCTAFVDALESALAEKSERVSVKTVEVTPRRAWRKAPPVAIDTTVAATAVLEPALADAVSPSATVAIAYAAPTQPEANRSRRRPIVVVAGAILVVLLVMGSIWFVARPVEPTLSLSASTVAAGDSLVVSATHVPANQEGTIQLHSAVSNFQFRSDASGNVSRDVTVPLDIGSGDHLVKICWASTCPKSTVLHVVDPVALATPTPEATPSPTATAQPTATPTQAPVPTSAPAPNPGPAPKPTPIPTPTPKPTPSPTPIPSITLVSVSVSGNTTVVFHNYFAGTANIFVCQNGTCRAAPGNPRAIPNAPSVTVTFSTPVGIVATTAATPWQARIIAGSVTSNSVNVTP